MSSVKIQEAIANALYLYNRPVNKALILTYEEALDDIKEHLVLEAIKSLVKSEKFMFTPAQIRDKIIGSPSEKDIGRNLAMKINQAIAKFGYPSPNQAREFIGEEGWKAVECWGGWGYLCTNVGDTIELTNFIAQTRDLIESNFKSQPMASGGVALNPGSDKKLLEEK